jgi:hypothetical protein
MIGAVPKGGRNGNRAGHSPAIAAEVVKRQTLKSSRGFAVLEDFEVTRSQTRKNQDVNYLKVYYTGTVRLVKDAAVWTENRPRGVGTTSDILHFEALPAADALNRKNVSQSRVYRFWEGNSVFPITGSVAILKTNEGWRAEGNVYCTARKSTVRRGR